MECSCYREECNWKECESVNDKRYKDFVQRKVEKVESEMLFSLECDSEGTSSQPGWANEGYETSLWKEEMIFTIISMFTCREIKHHPRKS